MIGYDVTINGKNISAAIDKGVLTLIVTRLNNEAERYIALDLTGLDTQNRKRPRWATMDLQEGDEIIVRIKNIEQISTPIKSDDIDEEADKKQKVANFYAMKERLEKEGLI